MTTQKQILCPYCRKEEVVTGSKYWPFCSQRCRTLDLGDWAKEKYRVAGEPVTDEIFPQTPEEGELEN